MSEIELKNENSTKDIQLFSTRAIYTTTFLAGPLAAGYMIGENFKALNKSKEAKTSYLLGIIVTVVIFGTLFIVPENVVDKLPNQLLPFIYTGVAYWILDRKQGDILKAHKENGNSFFSAWKSVGIGFTALILTVLPIIGFIFFEPKNEVYEKYDKEMDLFVQNESETLVFYDHLSTEPEYALYLELEDMVIPKWKENLQIIRKTYELEGLPSELQLQNKKLLEYSKIRLEVFELYRKSLLENTDKYMEQIELKHLEINKILEKLNQ